LPREQVELIAKFNREQLMFDETQLPQWATRAAQAADPTYPHNELDFTVNEGGGVEDIAVHAANPAGVFETAAVDALSKWRFKPVLKEARPAAQRARIRVRFTLAG